MNTYIRYFFLFFVAVLKAQTTYFVDNIIGDDKNNGTSQIESFKSIDRINQLFLKPGDSLLFKKGGTWIGNFSPKGSGDKQKTIVIGAYGKGNTPIMNAEGKIAANEKRSHTLRLYNQEYIEIRDLKIRNQNPLENSRKLVLKKSIAYVNTPKNGIYIEAKDCGTLHNISLINLEICEVNGDMSTKDNGGVFVEVTWNKKKSKRVKSNFEGLYTIGCFIYNIDRTGWSNRSVWNRRSLESKWGETLVNGRIDNWYPSTNIVHRNNKFERAGANALIVRVASSPLVEYCSFKYNGLKGSGNASFPFGCDDALFQYNEASYTFYNTKETSWDHKPDIDAGGFDSDWNCKNTIIQYNYSHDNGHGGVLICCNGASKTSFNDGTIIRYNVFENNEHHIVRNSGNTTNTKIYNNVFFTGVEHDSVQFIYHKSWGGYPDKTSYKNNIFYSVGKENRFEFGKSTKNFFEANTFYGAFDNEPNDAKKSKRDPLFENETSSITNWKSYLRFVLQNKSPEIDAGVDIEGHPMKDFLGNPIIGKPDRGVFEKNKI